VMTTVVGDVAAGYFSLLALAAELDIDKRTLATRENSLKLINYDSKGGLATMLDVRQAEELVYQASETIPDTERAIEQTENQISLFLGNNPGPIPRGQSLTQQQELPQVPLAYHLHCLSVARIFALQRITSKRSTRLFTQPRPHISRGLV